MNIAASSAYMDARNLSVLPPILLSRPNSVAQEKSFCKGSIAKMKNGGELVIRVYLASVLVDIRSAKVGSR
jgi:hypothetical protein